MNDFHTALSSISDTASVASRISLAGNNLPFSTTVYFDFKNHKNNNTAYVEGSEWLSEQSLCATNREVPSLNPASVCVQVLKQGP